MQANPPMVAIRSLISEHHAHNIEPKIFTIIWNLGKRCNYNCSYCSPHLHDWISPHHKLQDIEHFVDKLNQWSAQPQKTFKINLTGGEPFVHPDIIDILKIIRSASQCSEQLSVVTNGSLPLDLYQQSLEYLSNLTVSLHLDRPIEEVRANARKLVQLNQQFPHRFITAQIPCVPGRFDLIDKEIRPLFVDNNVKFTFRRIRPWQNEVAEWQDLSKREIIKLNYPLEQQSFLKKDYKIRQQNNLEQQWSSGNYYNEQENQWLIENIPEVNWQNIGTWDRELNYTERNSDDLAAGKQHKFNGWVCYVGIDGFFIDFDGQIYRGVCTSGGPIGHITESTLNLPTNPIVCPQNWCVSNPDQTTRKALPEYQYLITKA